MTTEDNGDFDSLLELDDEQPKEETKRKPGRPKKTPEPEVQADVSTEDAQEKFVQGVAEVLNEKIETDAQRRIRELEEILSKPVETSFDPPEEVNLDELRIRELEDKIAQRNNAFVNAAEPTSVELEDDSNVFYIHFVADGMTAFGKVWVRGEEIPFPGRESSTFKQTLNSQGKSWVDMTEDRQYEKYGQVLFRPGPWQGKKFEDPNLQKAAEKARRKVPTRIV